MTQQIVIEEPPAQPTNPFPGTYLSAREIEILRHTIRGKTARDIANLLHLSVRTIEHYLERIKEKFGVTTKAELIDKTIDYYL